MPVKKKTYTLGKIKQLIDLNEDSTNFSLSFKVNCMDETPFQILVVDQKTLDNVAELEYKDAQHTISGNLVADKNIKQNYFLIVKSETPCVVEIEIDKKELPENNDIITPNSFPSEQPLIRKPYKSSEPSMNWTKIILIGVVVIGGIILLYYLYNRNTDSGKTIDTSHENSNFKDFKSLYNDSSHQNSSFKDPWEHQSNESKSNTPVSQKSVNIKSFQPKLNYSSSNISRQSSNRSNYDDPGMSLIDRLKKISSK